MDAARGTIRDRRAIARLSHLLTAVLLVAAPVGCAGSNGRAIPRNAMDLGGGRSISVTAPSDGRIWIYNKEKNLVLFKGAVHAGDRISVVAASNTVQINGRNVTTGAPLEPRKRYRIYFKQ